MKIKLLSFLVSFGIVFLTFLPTAHAVTYSYSATNFQSTGCLTGSEFTQFNLTSAGDVITITGTGFGDRNLDDSNPEMVYIPTSNGVVSISQSQGLISWHDSEIQLKVNSGQGGILGSYIILRTYPGTRPDANGALSQSDCNRGTLATYVPPPPTCTTFTYSDWGTCTNGQQTRTTASQSPTACAGGNPILTQSCTPSCVASNYSCDEWSSCSVNGSQTRTCTRTSNCEGGVSMPTTSQSCTYTPPSCTSWIYSTWEICSAGGQQTRTVTSASPLGCTGGNPIVTQSCTPPVIEKIPKIISISPSSIHLGDRVEISGENFGDSQPTNCPVIPSTPAVPVQVACGVLDGNNQPQRIVNWSDTKIVAIIDNTATARYAGDLQPIRAVLHGFVSNNDRTREGQSGHIEVLAPLTCGDWGTCSQDGKQTRYCQIPSGAKAGMSTVETRTCRYVPTCSVNSYFCGDWGVCSMGSGTQTRTCNKTQECEGGVSMPLLSQGCGLESTTSTQEARGSFVLKIPSNRSDGVLVGDRVAIDYYGSDIITSAYLNSIKLNLGVDYFKVFTGVPAINSQLVSFTVPINATDGDVIIFTANNKRKNVGTIKVKTAPASSQTSPSQSPQPMQSSCLEDIWSCADWGSCSPNGIQARSCRKTFDCAVVEDAAPVTSRSCQPATSSSQSQNDSINREQILRATVKLECPTPDRKYYSQGSGTIIDKSGTILTNKHVVSGTIGSCRVGFINFEDDVPSFSQIADVKSVARESGPNGDMALLKIRNFSNKEFVAIDILTGNNNNLKSGDTILPFGYPDENYYGQTITFTEGPYSGKGTTIKLPIPCDKPTVFQPINVSGYFKTTASIDHGNSGGGAYQKSTGYYMGMPTLGSSCNPSIPSRINHILSINTIKQWLSSLGSYDVTRNNYSNLSNYLSSTVKIEEIDMSNLRALDSPTPDVVISNKIVDKSKGKKISESNRPSSPAVSKQLSPDKVQVTTNIESDSAKQEVKPVEKSPSTVETLKVSRLKRFFRWATNLFK